MQNREKILAILRAQWKAYKTIDLSDDERLMFISKLLTHCRDYKIRFVEVIMVDSVYNRAKDLKQI